jgi:hypothetical protein
MYGSENVAFMKVDGNNLYDISSKYAIDSYPSFIYVKPNSKGLKAVEFKGKRAALTMKNWM